MTCIVGVIHNRRVYMGGDSAGVSGYSVTSRKDPKVFRRGELVIGYTSSFRMGQVLRFSPSVPDKPEGADLYEWLCTKFVDGCRKAMKEAGYTETENGRESGGTFLVGVRGRLFTVQSDFQVGETRDGFSACGCGTDLALGAMAVTRGKKPEDRIRAALAVAERFSAGVRSPFLVVKE